MAFKLYPTLILGKIEVAYRQNCRITTSVRNYICLFLIFFAFSGFLHSRITLVVYSKLVLA